MAERRQYQAFLRASAGTKTSMRSVSALLPTASPAAVLWLQLGLLLANGVVPLALWFVGRLLALDLVLLYLCEGYLYGMAVFARVLFTATAACATGERPRIVTAIAYLVWHGALWSALGLGALLLIVPRARGLSMWPWLSMLLENFSKPALWLPALLIAIFLTLDVIRRSDYIDAYLELGPRETARYGYVYSFALIFLLFSASAIWFLLLGHEVNSSSNTPLMTATFLALWLCGWRIGLRVVNLTLPLWGRGLAIFEDRFENAMQGRGRDA